MSIDSPYWLFLIALVPMIAIVAILSGRQREIAAYEFVADRLRHKLVRARSPLQRFVPLALALIALILLAFVMTRPHAGIQEIEAKAKGRNIMIAIDLSRSMLTDDVSPSRLQVAKATILEVLDRFPNDRIGLLTFADNAWISAPLTLDHQAIREVLNELTPDYLPTKGSNLGNAIHLANETLTATGQADNALIIISDGEDHADYSSESNETLRAAETAAETGLTIFTLGVGTSDGGFIPDSQSKDGRYSSKDGSPVLSTLNESSLRNVAALSHGFYSRATGKTLQKSLSRAIAQLEQYEQDGINRTVPTPRYQYALPPAIILIFLAQLAQYRFFKTEQST